MKDGTEKSGQSRLLSGLFAALPVGAAIGFWFSLLESYKITVFSPGLYGNFVNFGLLLIYGFTVTTFLTLIIASATSVIASRLDIRGRLTPKANAIITATGLFLVFFAVILRTGYALRPYSDVENIKAIVFTFVIAVWSLILIPIYYVYVLRKYNPSKWTEFIGRQYTLTFVCGILLFSVGYSSFMADRDGITGWFSYPFSLMEIMWVVVTVLVVLISRNLLNRLFDSLAERGSKWVILTLSSILLIPLVAFLLVKLTFFPVRHNPNPSNHGRNVVLISIDTLRYDRLGCNGNEYIKTSNIDALAEEGHVFDQCYVPMPLTVPSHVSMLTGMMPRNHGVRKQDGRLDTSNMTLTELLSEKGFTCGGFVSMSMMRGDGSGLDQGFHIYDDAWAKEGQSRFFPPEVKYFIGGNIINRIFTGKSGAPLKVERIAEDAVDNAITWIDTVKDKDFFCFLHLFDPHWTYDAPEPFTEMYDLDYEGIGILKTDTAWFEDPWRDMDILDERDIHYFKALYDGEVSYVDNQLGRFFDHLKESGLWDDTLIILTADHGESFGHNYYFDHRFRLYQSCIHVPLIYKSFEGGENISGNSPCTIMDIFPTVCDALDFEKPGNLDGISLGEMQAEDSRIIKCESDGLRSGNISAYSKTYAVIKDGYKLIYSPWAEEGSPVFQLYNLIEDEAEERNLWGEALPVSGELLQLVMEWYESDEDPNEPVTGAIDRENLKSLQYLR